MAGSTDVVVKFLADVSDMKDGVDRIDKLGGTIKKAAFGIGGALAGAFAVDQVGDFISAAEDANVATGRLETTLQNAGDATGEWAAHAEDLATTLMNRTGIDDEVIKGAQAILATFHGVSGATGQMSGAFDRATTLALDMSKTGFGDANSAATMLGKALEDPQQGITALNRVGITFTEDQKKLIDTLLFTGDKAGAMGVILDNVQGQVGGVAENTVTASDKLKTSFGEMQEAVGSALLPVFQAVVPLLRKVADFVAENAGAWGEKLRPIMENVSRFIRENLIPALARIPDIFKAIVDWVKRNSQAFVNFAKPFLVIGGVIVGLVVIVAKFAAVLAEKLMPVFETVGGWLSDNEDFWTALGIGIAAAGAAILVTLVPAFIAWAGAALAAAAATLAAAAPFVIIGAAVAALAFLIINNWDTIVAATETAWGAVDEFITGVLEGLVMVLDWVAAPFQALGVWLAGPFSAAWEFIKPIAQWIVDKFAMLLGYIDGPFQAIADKIVGPFKAAFDIISDAFNGLMELLGLAEKKSNEVHRDARQGPSLLGPGNFPGPTQGPSLSGPGMGPVQGPSLLGPGRFHAAGGIFTRPTLGVIGEAGPEAVIPLDKSGLGGSPVTINVYTTGLGADAPSIQSAVVAALRQYTTRNGPLPAAIVG